MSVHLLRGGDETLLSQALTQLLPVAGGLPEVQGGLTGRDRLGRQPER